MRREVVVYCACCPFEHSPNTRPIEAVQSIGFHQLNRAKLIRSISERGQR